MADPYPSIPQRLDTDRVGSYDTTVDRAESGKPRFRTFFSKEWVVFVARHECTKAEMQSILDHYYAWGNESFQFTYAGDGVPYTVRYAEIPRTQVLDGDYLWRVEATLIVL